MNRSRNIQREREEIYEESIRKLRSIADNAWLTKDMKLCRMRWELETLERLLQKTI